MDKIAAYGLVLEKHPLWVKEGSKTEKRSKGGRGTATALSIPFSGGLPGLSSAAAAYGAEKGKGRRAAIGAGLGQLAGLGTAALLLDSDLIRRLPLNTTLQDVAALSAIPIGTGLGTYIAHGKNKDRS